MKRRPVLGLQYGNLPACIDVNFMGFSRKPCTCEISRSFLSDIEGSSQDRGVGLCFAILGGGGWDVAG